MPLQEVHGFSASMGKANLPEVRKANGEGSQCRDIVVGELAVEADRAHTGFLCMKLLQMAPVAYTYSY